MASRIGAGLDSPRLRALAATPISSPLYHYTTAPGLEGILRDRVAWATAARYLNDAQEVRYAIQLARARLDQLRGGEEKDGRRRRITYLMRSLDRIDSERPLVSVFSLSRRADDLSQWRAYCPESGGFSIGFAPEALRATAEEQQCVLAPCVYDPQDQRALIEESVDPVVERLPSRAPRAADALARESERHARRLLARVERVAPLIKWPDYAAEDEWRIIWTARASTLDRLRFRASESLFIPYVEIDLSGGGAKFPVEEIYVGPGAHQNNALVSLAYLLRSLGVRVRALKRSRIPLRSF